ncbi:Ig-like domain-containing protein [Streptomyces sp. NPDC002769]|uniref:Ig-like domain-containing protein n=1 Tax=Streptomyces sp. NPDC002769 TaxID=3154542 RepID=UPI003323DE9A
MFEGAAGERCEHRGRRDGAAGPGVLSHRSTVGVGMPISTTFDHAARAAERAWVEHQLKVTASARNGYGDGDGDGDWNASRARWRARGALKWPRPSVRRSKPRFTEGVVRS